MTRSELIEKHGYCVFDLVKHIDVDSTTPVSSKYQLIMICCDGEATFEANMQQVTMSKGDCLCFNNILYKKTLAMSKDFSAQVLICDRSFALEASVGIPTGYIEALYTMPIIKIDNPIDWQLVVNQFDNLILLQRKHFNLRHKEIVKSSLRSLIILMSGLRGGSDAQNLIFSHGDIYFRNFMELIDEKIKQQHEVAYYANQLHITAKYLSEVCKQKSGHKAKEIISTFLISKIKQEMIMSGKTIKDIAYEYGFADQSSMGKFFYKMTGMSPRDFKKSQESK